MNISSNISSISAHQAMMGSSANNVANVNTGGFRPTDTKVVGGDDSLKASSRKADDTGSKMSQTDLAKEMSDQIVAQDVTAVNVTAIKTQDEMLGSLLDIKA
jgi:flagellar hook protein FlgE